MPESPDLRSILLYQIIGAPLTALVDAEIQASMATYDFIRKVGFEGDQTSSSESGTTNLSSPSDNPSSSPPSQPNSPTSENEIKRFGDLKLVTFQYNKLDVSGRPIAFEVKVPLLSILPIPTLQIKEATLDFAVEINGVVELKVKEGWGVPHVSGQNSSTEDKLVGFKAALAKEDSKSAMKIHVEVGSGDVPVGLLTLFRMMEQGAVGTRLSSNADP